jgi:fructose-1-phosphate kinase PfkB-like protein
MVKIARRGRAKVLLDTSGGNLLAGTMAGPHIVKPNRVEAEAIGAKISAWDEAPFEASRLCRRYGLEAVLISGGSDGAVVASQSGVWSARAPRTNVVSTLGCGDSATAGFLWGLARNPDDLSGALRWAVAAGAANTLCRGPGLMAISDIEAMWGRIETDKMA